jgi:hypothetical protein
MYRCKEASPVNFVVIGTNAALLLADQPARVVRMFFDQRHIDRQLYLGDKCFCSYWPLRLMSTD